MLVLFTKEPIKWSWRAWDINETRVSITRVSKQWYITKYFANNSRTLDIIVNDGIWPFWREFVGKGRKNIG